MVKPLSTRYERVKAILDAAVEGSHAGYAGQGRFRDSRDKLLTVSIHDVRMIAPEMPASGLIRGLRGGPPFDGSRFPPLP